MLKQVFGNKSNTGLQLDLHQASICCQSVVWCQNQLLQSQPIDANCDLNHDQKWSQLKVNGLLTGVKTKCEPVTRVWHIQLNDKLNTLCLPNLLLWIYFALANCNSIYLFIFFPPGLQEKTHVHSNADALTHHHKWSMETSLWL